MPFDALFLGAVRGELERTCVGCRVDKIQQPVRDTILLSLRGPAGGGKLLLSASANRPRIHLTQTSPENPAQPPMLCMLLRKHLTGGRLRAVTQPPMERLVELVFDCTDEMGTSGEKHLILEVMGRSSNLILTGADGRIIDCLRRVDLEMSEKRQVLPGLYYRLPPAQDKRDPFSATEAELRAMLATEHAQKQFDRWLLETFAGISPLVCRELSMLLMGDTEADLSALDDDGRAELGSRLYAQFRALQSGDKTPILLLREGKPWDFSCIPVTQYGAYVQQQAQPSFSALLDRFYSDRDREETLRQKTQALRKTLTTLHARTARKLENQRRELTATYDREHLRRLGDILTANLHAVPRGASRFTAEDFYDPELRPVEIPLNPALSPQQNAAKFYKDYQKAKNAEKILTAQIASGEQELEYLASIQDALARAESERDIREIREELTDGGYLRRTDRRKQMKLPPAKPMCFRSSDGFLIRVGRNNRQNDQLTLRQAAKTDIWLHTQKIPGSHVIIETNGSRPPDETVTEAMMLAAYYSQARGGQNVPVDYTPVKYVKKPNGAKPGMVVYETYQTAFVTPDETLPEKLREDAP